MKLKHLIIGLIIVVILILINILCKSTEKNITYERIITNGSIEFTKKKKAKKKKTKKKVKKVKKTKKNTTKKVATASIGTYQEYARNYGRYNNQQMNCLINLWNRESGWNPNSKNKYSGACGIPQAYPCSKIKKQQGSNNWMAQIRWGINYINYRYGSPCGAWNHFQKKHWY